MSHGTLGGREHHTTPKLCAHRLQGQQQLVQGVGQVGSEDDKPRAKSSRVQGLVQTAAHKNTDTH